MAATESVLSKSKTILTAFWYSGKVRVADSWAMLSSVRGTPAAVEYSVEDAFQQWILTEACLDKVHHHISCKVASTDESVQFPGPSN